MALSKQNRLGSSRDFSKVHRKGHRAATKHLAIRALKHKKYVSADGKPSALLRVSAPANQRADQQVDLRDKQSVKQLAKQPAQQPAADSQFGISISRKVSKRAVVRNRIKRQIKAIIRERLPYIQPGWQVVIVIRTTAVECEFDDFLRELECLFKKVGLWTSSNPKPPPTKLR